MQQLRQRIANDLHDEVGANLGSIAITSEMLEHVGHLDSPRERGMLADIHRTASETATEIRLLTRFLEKKGIEGSLIAQFNRIARQMLPGIPCTLDFAAAEQFDSLAPIEKWELLLFLKEALHNIVKHAQATQVTIRTSASARVLHLEICDNGKGLRPGQSLPAHLELRAQKLNTHLKSSTPDGSGTIIQLDIPRKRKR